MAEFPGLALTNKGLELQTKAQAGKELNFSRVALGDGVVPPDPKILQTLVAEQQSLPLTSLLMIEAGHVRLRVVLTNDDVVAGFYIREVGVFAIDPDTGIEYLYAYSNAGEFADYMPAGGGATVVEHEVDLITVVGDAANLTATIDKSKVYATQQDLEDLHEIIDASNGVFAKKVDVEATYLKQDDATATYLKQDDAENTYATDARVNSLESNLAQCATTNELTALENSIDETYTSQAEFTDHLNQAEVALDGPQLIFPGSSNTFDITNYNIFSVYSASATVGATSIIDNQIILDIAVGETASGTVLTVTQDGATKEFNIAIGSQSISKPSILAPSNNATNVGDEALLVSSEFECFPSGEFTHISTDYQIATDSNFVNIIWQSMADTENLLSVRVPAETLQTSTEYFLRLRHNGDNGTNTSSTWSDIVIFTTANSFALANEAAALLGSSYAKGDLFGDSVDISGDGSTIIAGSPNAGSSYQGRCHIFSLVNNSYQEDTILIPNDNGPYDRFGCSTSLSNDGQTAVIGARNDGGTGSYTGHGSAYIFSNKGGFWTPISKLKPLDISPGDMFGYSVALSGDGSTIAVASPGETVSDDSTTYYGAVYIFKNISGNTWQQTAKVLGRGGNYGFNLQLNYDGDRLLVSADSDSNIRTNSGAVYLYNNTLKNGVTWQEVIKFKAPDADQNDYFGSSIALSGDGKTILVGAKNVHTSVNYNGSAYVFSEHETDGWLLVAKLPPDKIYNLKFGNSVSLSHDGSVAIIGTTRNRAYLFTKKDQIWTKESTITTSSSDNDSELDSISLTNNGKVCILGSSNARIHDNIASGAVFVYK